MKKSTKNTKTTPKVEESVKKITRDMTKISNAEIAKRVKNGEYGEDWRYIVRKKGYCVKAIEVLLHGMG